MTTRAQRGRDIVQQTFGGALYQQGRGFYSGLELLAILRGEVLLERLESNRGTPTERVLPSTGPARYLRPSHDHARRLLVSDKDVVDGVFGSDLTREAVKSLLHGLEAPVPGRRQVPDKWQLRHFYPYPAEAIHYDAVERRGKVSVERYQFRGAGGLAHRVLRTDPDTERLGRVRDRVRDLLKDSGSAVGQLLTALSEHDSVRVRTDSSDYVPDENWFEDDVEGKSLGLLEPNSKPHKDTRWTRLLREGVDRILARDELTEFDRIEGLLHWVPLCVSMHQLTMAKRCLGRPEDSPLVFDAGHRKSPVRSLARKHFGAATALIKDSLHEAARASGAPELVQGSAAWWTGPRSFFATTMFAVGAANANTGLRHFELRPQLLQMIVHALVDIPLPYASFTGDVLGDRLGFICDEVSAARHGGVELDGRDLKTNGQLLAARLEDVGLMRALSDTTLMVGIH